MFLLLHALATDRRAQRIASAGITFIFVVGYAIVHASHQTATVPSLPRHAAALPACTSTADTAGTEDCIIQVFAWCSVNEPSQKPSDCATAALVSGVTKN